MVFHGRSCILIIKRSIGDEVTMSVHDGFVPVAQAQVAVGDLIAGEAEEGAPGIHLANLFMRIAKRKGVWRAQTLKRELCSLSDTRFSTMLTRSAKNSHFLQSRLCGSIFLFNTFLMQVVGCSVG